MLLSLRQTAQQLNMSCSGLRKIIARGDLPYCQARKGGRVCFREEWIQAYIDEHTRYPTAKLPTLKEKPTPLSACSIGNHGFD